MRIIYVGTSGDLSTLPFKGLLKSGHQVCAVALYSEVAIKGKGTKFPIFLEDLSSLQYLARQNNIPIIKLEQNISDSVEEFSVYQPDAMIVSCFPYKIPECLLSIPSMGCFNLHPSLLPAYRGPVPLFWQFREGCSQFGITLHRMTLKFDAGDIVGQSTTTFPDGIDINAATNTLAKLAANLLVCTLDELEQGIASVCVQDEKIASYNSFPLISDYVVHVSWTAKRVYNFICATRQNGITYPCIIKGQYYRLLQVYSYSNNGIDQVSIKKDTITIPCSKGWVTAQFESS